MLLRYRIKEAYYQFKFRCQRFIRGYADEDVWGMDMWFIEGMQKLLPKYIKKTDGYPGTITAEEWNKILNKMLHYLNGMTEDGAKKQLFGETENLTLKQIRQIEEHMVQCEKEFFALYTKWFYHLWY